VTGPFENSRKFVVTDKIIKSDIFEKGQMITQSINYGPTILKAISQNIPPKKLIIPSQFLQITLLPPFSSEFKLSTIVGGSESGSVSTIFVQSPGNDKQSQIFPSGTLPASLSLVSRYSFIGSPRLSLSEE
jgi:hypothetical protein